MSPVLILVAGVLAIIVLSALSEIRHMPSSSLGRR
jgi:hypothetical protein